MSITEIGEHRIVSPEINLSVKATHSYQVLDGIPKHIPHSRHSFYFLTSREREVLRLVADGHTDRMVAETLVISPRTVNRHLSNIFTKLSVPGRAAAVALAIRHGLF
jgi:DNA-binding NarL/FixJ family response regulator